MPPVTLICRRLWVYEVEIISACNFHFTCARFGGMLMSNQRENDGEEMIAKFFPSIIIALFIAASVVCFWHGDIRMGIFNLLSAAINIVVNV